LIKLLNIKRLLSLIRLKQWVTVAVKVLRWDGYISRFVNRILVGANNRLVDLVVTTTGMYTPRAICSAW